MTDKIQRGRGELLQEEKPADGEIFDLYSRGGEKKTYRQAKKEPGPNKDLASESAAPRKVFCGPGTKSCMGPPGKRGSPGGGVFLRPGGIPFPTVLWGNALLFFPGEYLGSLFFVQALRELSPEGSPGRALIRGVLFSIPLEASIWKGGKKVLPFCATPKP